jgi:hypothetical protein
LFGKIEPSQLPDYLTRFLAAHLSEAIRIYGPEDSGRQIELANAVLESVSRRSDELAYLLKEQITRTDEQEVLEELCGKNAQPLPRPLTELSASSLLTGAPGLPQLGREIELELASADRCDMLVAFVKSGGMRLLREPLKKFTDRGGQLRLRNLPLWQTPRFVSTTIHTRPDCMRRPISSNAYPVYPPPTSAQPTFHTRR